MAGICRNAGMDSKIPSITTAANPKARRMTTDFLRNFKITAHTPKATSVMRPDKLAVCKSKTENSQ